MNLRFVCYIAVAQGGGTDAAFASLGFGAPTLERLIIDVSTGKTARGGDG